MQEASAEKRGTAEKLGWLPLIALKAAKLISALKSVAVLQPLITVVSAAGSVFAYSFALGWEFAAGFVGNVHDTRDGSRRCS